MSAVAIPDALLGTMKKMFVHHLEPGQPHDSLPPPKAFKGKTLAVAVNETLEGLNSADRGYTLEYFDKDATPPDCWAQLGKEVDMDDLADPPKFLIQFTSSKKTFDHTAILNVRNGELHFKKFAGAPSASASLPRQPPFEPRAPQKEALFKLRKVLLPAAPGSRFMMILPTGCGKTMVMAMSPFMLDATKVLYILPSLTLRNQVANELRDAFSPGKLDSRATIQMYTAGSGFSINADAVVTNIQALVHTEKKKKVDGDVVDDVAGLPPPPAQEQTSEGPQVDAPDSQLTNGGRRLVDSVKPDVVIIDEGHHFPASSWECFAKHALDTNKDCKFILLTATPQRGDGATYNLPEVSNIDDAFYYLYTRKEAIAAKYIKNIQFWSIEPTFVHPELPTRYNEEAYIYSLIDPAVSKLLGLRKSCNWQPLRMLVNARTNKHAALIAGLINARSKEKKWGLEAGSPFKSCLRAEAITGAEKQSEIFKQNFKLEDGNIDIAVQVKMLGEGYDNSLIAVTTFVAPAKSVGTLSQIHGRAIRKPKFEIDGNPRALESWLFYPDEVDRKTGRHVVHEVVEEYKDGKDESIGSL